MPETPDLALIPSWSPPSPEVVDRQAQLTSLVLSTLHSEHSKRSYRKSLGEMFTFLAGRPISRQLLLEWRESMAEQAPATVNLRMAAARKLVLEARRSGYVGVEEAAALADLPNRKQLGARLGNWLTRDQAKALLCVPDRATLKGLRDVAILSILVNCALRRDELARMDTVKIQLREGRWVFLDIKGKGGRIRTVGIPLSTKGAIDAWTRAAGIEDGRLLRSVGKGGKRIGESMTDDAVYDVVAAAAAELGIESFGAHDLRRTCAKLCRRNGGDLEQIKFLLGHSSIQTTERYLGSEQELVIAVNDNLGL